jgi:hypothetical protein
MRKYRPFDGGLMNTGQIDPLLPFPVGTRYGRNVHMSGPSVEQADWGWHFG